MFSTKLHVLFLEAAACFRDVLFVLDLGEKMQVHLEMDIDG